MTQPHRSGTRIIQVDPARVGPPARPSSTYYITVRQESNEFSDPTLNDFPRFVILTKQVASRKSLLGRTDRSDSPETSLFCKMASSRYFAEVTPSGSTIRVVLPDVTSRSSDLAPDGQTIVNRSALSAWPRPKVSGCSTDER